MSISIGRGGKPKLCVGWLPGRKRPSLYLWTALDIRTLASFKNQAAADEAVSFLESLVGCKIVDADLSEEPVRPDLATGEAPAASPEKDDVPDNVELQQLPGKTWTRWEIAPDLWVATPVRDDEHGDQAVEDYNTILRLVARMRPPYAEPTPNSAAEKEGGVGRVAPQREDEEVGSRGELRAEIRALLEALEKIIAEVSERRVGHREKIADIARTAIDQAKSSTEEVP